MMREVRRSCLRCLVFIIGLLAVHPGSAEDSVKIFPELAGTVTFMDGRPCSFEQEYDFCSVGYRGGGARYTDPTGKYFIDLKGISHEDNPFPLPVTPFIYSPDTCDAVIVVVDADTCSAIRLININPMIDISQIPLGTRTAFSRDGSFLTLEYRDGSSVVYQAPTFGDPPAMVAPYSLSVLGRLDRDHYLIMSSGVGDVRGQYRVLKLEGGTLSEVFQVCRGDWGVSLVGDLNRGGPTWEAVFFDERGFVVRFPSSEGTDGPSMLQAFSNSGSVSEIIELTSNYEDLTVERHDGILRCSWTAEGHRVFQEFVTRKGKKSDGSIGWWYPRLPEPTYRLDRRGKLKRINDGSVCDYSISPDGSRIGFLPYGRGTHLWSSPGGRYLVIPGALNPEQNPNSGPVDRPGCFRKGYDSVLAVVDIERCRIVRFINIPPERTWLLRSTRFSPDGSLLLFQSDSSRTVVYKAPEFEASLSITIPAALPPGRSNWPLEMFKSKTSGDVYFWWFSHQGGVLLRRRGPFVDWSILSGDWLEGLFVKHFLYSDENLVVLIAYNSETSQQMEPRLIEVPLQEGLSVVVETLPVDAMDVSVNQDEAGNLVCSYRLGDRIISLPLRTSPVRPVGMEVHVRTVLDESPGSLKERKSQILLEIKKITSEKEQ